mgnify:CR=1 FL=1
MAANPKAPPELQPLLDKAYRDYQTDLDNLREGAADVIENMVERDPPERQGRDPRLLPRRLPAGERILRHRARPVGRIRGHRA